ncbi:MAG: hypothetical protein RMA76_13930 [Deltaproteobacteria bacterium]|jgi:hypothetical protein
MKRMTWMGALALAFVYGCPADSVQTVNPPPIPPTTTPDPVDVVVTTEGEGELLPPEARPEDPFRRRRRMDLDQLDAAIRQVTGGIGWTEQRGNTEVNLFEELASTLGKPDYIQTTDENLDPSAMFQKFLDDASRAVCDDLMVEEGRRAEADRVFFQHATPSTTYADHPAAVEANLIALLLRFHGRKLEAGAPELEPWKWLFQSADHVTESQPAVWRTLCVGLFTHPDFYTY